MTENIEKDLLQRSAEETEAAAGQENEQAACRQEGQAADREPEQAAGQETDSAADRGPEPGAGEQEPSAPVLKKAGFATIIGRPNVGKSTLMNRMIGQKIAITSYKPQTTRGKIRTIYTDDQGQIVFLDTPGIHKSNNRLGTYMLKASSSTLKEVDVILYLIEPRQKRDEEEMEILEQLRTVKRPKILVINKIDKTPKEKLLPLMAAYATTGSFRRSCPSAPGRGKALMS